MSTLTIPSVPDPLTVARVPVSETAVMWGALTLLVLCGQASTFRRIGIEPVSPVLRANSRLVWTRVISSRIDDCDDFRRSKLTPVSQLSCRTRQLPTLASRVVSWCENHLPTRCPTVCMSQSQNNGRVQHVRCRRCLCPTDPTLVRSDESIGYRLLLLP